MEWFILSRDMHILCAPSTLAPMSLPIYNDKQTILISNNVVVSTYDFTVPSNHKDANSLQMGNYIVFRDKYKKMRMYTLVSYDGDDISRTWHSEDVGMDLINETANKWTLKEPHPIDWYLNKYVLDDSGWTIGINEISNLTRSLSFDGQSDSKLTRLGDIANQFDGAEVDFTIEMNGSTITKQVVNIYKKVGTDLTQQRFVDSVNLQSLQSSGSIANICTAMLGLGSSLQNEDSSDGGQITFINELYDDGRYYSPVGQPYIFDRVGRQQWSRYRGFGFDKQGEFEGYIDGLFTYDTSDPKELLKRTLTEIKKRVSPEETFQANLLDIKADVGDYVQIAHNNYNPPIYLSARVEQVENCYTADGQDIGTLGDYTRLQSQIDPRVQQMMDGLANQLKYSYTWIRYAKDDKGTGMTSTPTTDTKYVAIVPNKPTGVPSDNPADYAGHWQLIQGTGPEGIQGPKGPDGKSSYTHIAYGTSNSGAGFTQTPSTSTTYIGMYVDQTATDNNDPKKYAWSLIKGADGTQGTPGAKGVDGKTPYFHQAWADSKDGKTNFSTTDPTNRGYLGTYSDFTQADSTDPTKYFWVELVGAFEVGSINLIVRHDELKDTMINPSGEVILFAGSSLTKAVVSVKPGNALTMTRYNSVADNNFRFAFYDASGALVKRGYSADLSHTEDVPPNAATFRISYGTALVVKLERGRKSSEYTPAPEDTQGQIDKVNNGLEHVEGLYNSILTPIASVTAPTNPKTGQQWWVLDADGKTLGLKIWNGSVWKDAQIQQSAMNIGTLNGNIINGATINSSNFNVAFDETAESSGRSVGPYFKGTQVIKGGSYLSDYTVKGTTQTGFNHITPDGITNRSNDTNGEMVNQASLGQGYLTLTEKGNTSLITGVINAQDAYRNSTQSIQYLGGWGDWGNGAGLITVTRNGRMVTLSGYPKQNGSSNFSNIAQLPEWAKPTRDVNLPAMSLNKSVLSPMAAKLVINTNGVLSATFTQQSGYVAIGASYFGKDIS